MVVFYCYQYINDIEIMSNNYDTEVKLRKALEIYKNI